MQVKPYAQGFGVAVVVGLVMWASGVVVLGSSAKRDAAQAAASATASVQADYCVKSYLAAPDRTVDQVKQMKGLSNSAQATDLQKGKFAPDQAAAEACGKAIDRLDDAQIAAGMKKVAAAAVEKK
ncbi:hypothetical protein A2419_01505 [Candidatus Adlerbacteria bacterium RIFOXYC1_FULL_48_26]|uniref:Uncharacterized protein n=1 Tax=Candidatus Adlerbacteria bacterium RIFOXYC1_FULL_48_26 TaxID=1797247 RepID=A0A1F4Y2C8_9BACT|nr:MAG: hypothetical protein A2419_01505 [Candidatus Adlerbacteria bacterium RIFOXYC1_FULL_48_26]